MAGLYTSGGVTHGVVEVSQVVFQVPPEHSLVARLEHGGHLMGRGWSTVSTLYVCDTLYRSLESCLNTFELCVMIFCLTMSKNYYIMCKIYCTLP